MADNLKDQKIRPRERFLVIYFIYCWWTDLHNIFRVKQSLVFFQITQGTTFINRLDWNIVLWVCF